MPPKDPTADSPPRARSRASWATLLALVIVIWGGSQTWGWWREHRAVVLIQQLARPGDIVMYTTTNCPYCARARQWLSRHEVPWRECNIDIDRTCLAAFQSQGAPGVPLLQVKKQWRLGFDQAWLAEALQR